MPLLQVIRYVVFAIVAAASLVALAAWVVRTRKVSPFSGLGRVLRAISEPFIKPTERWVVKRGGNPQNAGWWVFGVALVGGIVVISLAGWVTEQLMRVSAASTSGRGSVQLVVYYAFQLLQGALLVRVIASWFGAFRYNRWMRPVYLLTDWMIVPLQKIIPPIGMIDITPIVAWFLLRILQNVVLSAI